MLYIETMFVVICAEGEDALIVACEDDHYVVVAGTFEKLVEQLACEEKPGTHTHTHTHKHTHTYTYAHTHTRVASIVAIVLLCVFSFR